MAAGIPAVADAAQAITGMDRPAPKAVQILLTRKHLLAVVDTRPAPCPEPSRQIVAAAQVTAAGIPEAVVATPVITGTDLPVPQAAPPLPRPKARLAPVPGTKPVT